MLQHYFEENTLGGPEEMNPPPGRKNLPGIGLLPTTTKLHSWSLELNSQPQGGVPPMLWELPHTLYAHHLV